MTIRMLVRTPWVCRAGVLVTAVTVALFHGGCVTADAPAYRQMLEDVDELAPPEVADDGEVDLAAKGGLDREALIQAVLEKNPNLEAARMAWRAALAEYPQAVSLPDPSLNYTVAPGSALTDARFGQIVQLSQRFPPPGTLDLQGEQALAEARAAMAEYASARQELALMASILFDDYFVVARSLEILEAQAELVESLREVALSQYGAGRGAQKDPIEAQLELTHLRHRRIQLETEQAAIVARLNRLLHRAPEAPLPAPPTELPVPEPLERDTDALQALALEHRSELEARAALTEAAEASVGIAEEQYSPGWGVMATYNSMWMQWEHQLMVGVMVDLPVRLERRDAQVDEAEARLRRSERLGDALVDDVLTEVETARLQYVEALHVVRLYDTEVVPLAEDLVESARAGYQADKNDFDAVLRAERALHSARLNYETAIANAYQAQARLLRATGELTDVARDTEETR